MVELRAIGCAGRIQTSDWERIDVRCLDVWSIQQSFQGKVQLERQQISHIGGRAVSSVMSQQRSSSLEIRPREGVVEPDKAAGEGDGIVVVAEDRQGGSLGVGRGNG